MLNLKDYQSRALDALRAYFRACGTYGDPDVAYYQTTEEWMGQRIPYRVPTSDFKRIPYVCLRIPTGGGKTLMACYGVGIAQREYLQSDRSIILWLVPSNAIREQTLNALKNRRHPYRLALESNVGPVEPMAVGEAFYLKPGVLMGQTVVIVATMQAFRVTETEGRKVYEQNGELKEHFSDLAPEARRGMDVYENGEPIPSLANLLRKHRPVVVVDEAHNARTELSFDTLARFRPACILEFTATPDTDKNPSNVLYSCSAAELQAESMIKMPIRLETRGNWKELLSDAIDIRAKLETVANRERQATGEYIRPIMLLQAQSKSKNQDRMTVEVIEQSLLNDFKIPAEQIARATGNDKDLDGVDLLSTDCPIRFIITVQALREGWDCPFAYVLCSVTESESCRAVEQILGRILRLPHAQKKQQPELNMSYAFASSNSFLETAKSLQDALIQNGFQRQEVEKLIIPASNTQQDDFFAEDGDLFSTVTTVVSPELPDVEALPPSVRADVTIDTRAGTFTYRGEMTEEVKEALQTYFKTDAGKAAVEEAYHKSKPKSLKLSVQPKPLFSIPVLAIKQDDFIEQLEETHLLDHEWRLSECDALLSEQEYASERPSGVVGQIEVTAKGDLRINPQDELVEQLSHLGRNDGWDQSTLVHWLDSTIPHDDISPDESGIFLCNLVRTLVDQRGIPLDHLVVDKLRLRHAITRKIEAHRFAAMQQAHQSLLFPEAESNVIVTPDVCFTYDPEQYPYSSIYRGAYTFKKHYFDKVGDLKADGEEFECAVFLDHDLPEVKTWVRNLERRPFHSFWLQTSTDKFYPDFVCLLNDGRFLVVEYKGEHLWSNDDSKEKRLLGELWEKRSGGRCLFVMPCGKDFELVRTKVK